MRLTREPRPEYHLYLIDPGDGKHREDAIQRNVGLGFFQRLPPRTFLDGLAELEIAGRQGPVAEPRLDGAAAHQHGALRDDHGANHDLRVFVGNMAALGADHALTLVTLRNAPNESNHVDKFDRLTSRDQSHRA